MAGKDAVLVHRRHNPELAGQPFEKLDKEIKQAFLGYEFSTHILPASTGDEEVYRIFARLNSTGLSLNKQELRNAEYHGAFKSLAYELSFRFLNQWRGWKVYTNDAISRMDEAESVSELLMTMVQGLGGKTQAKINRFCKDHDDDFAHGALLEGRFVKMMNLIDDAIGAKLPGSAFQRPALFFSLWVALYDHVFSLKGKLKRKPAKALPAGLLAHSSEAAITAFRSKVPGVGALPPNRRLPGPFLRHQFRVAPDQRRLDLYCGALLAAASEMTAAWSA